MRSSKAAVFLAAAALAGALPAAPGCTVVSGWSDLQSGLSRDAGTPATGPTTTGSTSSSSDPGLDAGPPPDGSAAGDVAPTDLPACTFGTPSQSSCACSSACEVNCSGKQACQFVVQGFASASLDCTAGGCTYWCLGGNCDGDCTGGGCVVHCRTGAFCSFDCTGGRCVFLCEGGTCANRCTGGDCRTQ